MLFLRFVLLLVAIGLVVWFAGMVAYDVFLAFELDRLLRRKETPQPALQVEEQPKEEGAMAESRPALPFASAHTRIPRRRQRIILEGSRRRTAVKLLVIAGACALLRGAIVVVPDGEAGVRVSQLSGVVPGTLYAGTHLVWPLIDRVQTYDIRDHVFSTSSGMLAKEKFELLTVESREGLSLGVGVTVRYRIDATRLDYVQANLPQPMDEEIVEPVVTSAFRELAPQYEVRDVFSTKRDEFRQRAAKEITARLAEDAIDVKEVLLRKIQLPKEYAEGLEGLLLKEQQDDQTDVQADIEKKMVKIAESQAEGAKIREVKRAEADAASRVIAAKSQADSMQYTLPLKQKQIEETRLEAQARKEATIQDAEAQAQAKVIDSKAEVQRDNLLAEADANRIRVTAAAHAQELQLEAAALKSNPLLVQYTVAQKLSDKVQIMLVPSDGKFFFTNDVLRSAMSGNAADPPAQAAGQH
ncbi:MAG TPA: SPFH domain-containing protein [Candidatus Acidoferrales bacterium]|nr:SPFH domain-containing protein [Candidatus Acidoferrales bacterium]